MFTHLVRKLITCKTCLEIDIPLIFDSLPCIVTKQSTNKSQTMYHLIF